MVRFLKSSHLFWCVGTFCLSDLTNNFIPKHYSSGTITQGKCFLSLRNEGFNTISHPWFVSDVHPDCLDGENGCDSLINHVIESIGLRLNILCFINLSLLLTLDPPAKHAQFRVRNWLNFLNYFCVWLSWIFRQPDDTVMVTFTNRWLYMGSAI